MNELFSFYLANVTLYPDQGGARVFSAGTIIWCWGLDGPYFDSSMVDNYEDWAPLYAPSPELQRLTANILNNFLIGPALIASFHGPQPPIQFDYVEYWGQDSLVYTWPPAEDIQLVGDFMQAGHDQVLFINRLRWVGRRVSILDFSSGQRPGQVAYFERWGDSRVLDGWHDPEDIQLVGDFIGAGHDQVLFINCPVSRHREQNPR